MQSFCINTGVRFGFHSKNPDRSQDSSGSMCFHSLRAMPGMFPTSFGVGGDPLQLDPSNDQTNPQSKP